MQTVEGDLDDRVPDRAGACGMERVRRIIRVSGESLGLRRAGAGRRGCGGIGWRCAGQLQGQRGR